MIRQTVLALLAFSVPCLGQDPIVLDMDLGNETNYRYNAFGYVKVGTDFTNTTVNREFKSFAISVAVDDIITISAEPAKGVFLFKGFRSGVVTTDARPALFHSDFQPVTQARPALEGGVLVPPAITVSALAKPGHVASEATDPLMPALRNFEAGLFPKGTAWKSSAS